MNRRELIIGFSAAARDRLGRRAARAQQKAMPVIGYLSSGSPGPYAPFVAAFRQGLSETGYVEGQNLAIEYRWAEGRYDRLPALAADLVGRKVDVIVTRAAPLGARGEKRDLDDPDRLRRRRRPGRARPGRQSRPAGRQPHGRQLPHRRADAQAAGAAVRAGSPGQGHRPAREPEQSEYRAHDARRAGSGATEGVQLPILKAGTESEIDAAFATLVQLQAGALVVGADPFFNSRREQLVALASRHAVPAIYQGANSPRPAA